MFLLTLTREIQGAPESDGFQLQWYPLNKPGVNPGQPNQHQTSKILRRIAAQCLDSWKVDEASFGECYEDLSLAKKVLQALKAMTRHARKVEDG